MTHLPLIRRCTAIVGVLLGVGGASCARDYGQGRTDHWGPGTAGHTVAVGNDERDYLLHVPAAPRRSRLGVALGFPLVILLHGSGADGETVRAQSRIEHVADSLHIVVAYPNGSTSLLGFGSDWNAGACCGNAARSHVDDVAFIRAIVSEVSHHMPVDARRVFVAGFSDGGRMAYRAACDLSTVIAAIGVVSGSLKAEQCAPTRAVPIIAFHGKGDTEVPYDDSIPNVTLTSTSAAESLPPSIEFWSVVDRCKGHTARREAPHVVRTTFTPCTGADIVLYTVEDGGHAWPGGERDGSDGAISTTELHATERMLDFFLRHPRR